jgi:hypothetical protein
MTDSIRIAYQAVLAAEGVYAVKVSPHLRIGYANNPEVIEAGLARLGEFLDAF